MDIGTIIGIITAISTSTFAFLAVYKHLTRTRLKIAGYEKIEREDGAVFSAVVARKGKKAAKGCEAHIQVNNLLYEGQWANWDVKQDIHTSEELQLFRINKVQETITFLPAITPRMADLPLSDYRDKNLEIVLTSENADGASDKKTIYEIICHAKESA